MVRIPGLETFAEYFADDFARFVVIGGAARELIYEDAGFFEESATKDLDVVLVAEELNPAFIERFVSFIRMANYQHRTKDGRYQMFRFSKPSSGIYPAQIELLSKRPAFVQDIEQHIGPIPVDESGYSLSAILLDEGYYDLISSGVAVTRKYGIPILRHEYLPLFKMRAYIDLVSSRRAEANKHRRDIFKLLSLELPPQPAGLPEAVLEDVRVFLDVVEIDGNLMRNLRLDFMKPEEMLGRIRAYYL